jgi:hypothetical protein
MYGGKQLAMIADAYRNGMLPNLPASSVRKVVSLYPARENMDRTTTAPSIVVPQATAPGSHARQEAVSKSPDIEFHNITIPY